MRNYVLILSFILTILFPLSSYAAQYQEISTISHVEYNQDCKAYLVNSVNVGDGSWVLYLMSAENENKAILDGLNSVLRYKQVLIVYDDMDSLDTDNWIVLDWSVIDTSYNIDD